ncbi:ABC transporter permease [Anoxynatronum buryatiense]|uniref:NitT/TauT family transport system permease protein n=1 Tax=Anoxynatronum buryatiense TaxID=489973 RepID=A0AA45WWP6_9CLOT|nr:ABC transporter permease [Anoxynatronum buryatiense]SMP60325.1 NitT/TauT family transport system permease protein [Anoxynatronum buryatiense]
MNKQFKWTKWMTPVILPVFFLIIWQLAAVKMDNRMVLPTVSAVLSILAEPTAELVSIGSLIRNTWISLLRVALGYLTAAMIAIPLGVFIGYSKRLDRLVMPFLSLFRPIAPLAWVPLVLAWFGVSSLATMMGIRGGQYYSLLHNIKLSMIFIIFIGAFFPILTNSIYGVKNVKQTLVDSAKTLGATRREIMMKVLLPGALPSMVTGLRVGLGVAWMCLVSAEMLPGSLAGIGYLITHAYTLARTDIVIAGMICIGLVGGLMDFLFCKIEDRWFRWQKLEK